MSKLTCCWILSNFYFFLGLGLSENKECVHLSLAFFFSSPFFNYFCTEVFPSGLTTDRSICKRWALFSPKAFARREIVEDLVPAVTNSKILKCNLRQGGWEACCQPPLRCPGLAVWRWELKPRVQVVLGRTETACMGFLSKSSAGVQLLPLSMKSPLDKTPRQPLYRKSSRGRCTSSPASWLEGNLHRENPGLQPARGA